MASLERRAPGRTPRALRAPGWLLACLAALLWLGGCGGDPEQRVYDVRGVVRDVHPEIEQLVVEHEDIPGLMPAMTMNFDVADAALLERLEPGHQIRFRLEVTPRSYRILEATLLEVGELPQGGLRLDAAAAAADRAPAFRLRDQAGREVTLANFAGRAVLLDFIYTRCAGPCPILTGLHVDAQRQLSDELRRRTRFVSITLDPTYDSPDVLRRYAEARGADLAHWSFLTGAAPDVDAVIRSYGVGRMPGADGQIEHLVVSFLIDPQGRIARRFVGLSHQPEELVRALERVLG